MKEEVKVAENCYTELYIDPSEEEDGEKESEVVGQEVLSITTDEIQNAWKGKERGKTGKHGLTTDLINDAEDFVINNLAKMYIKYLE